MCYRASFLIFVQECTEPGPIDPHHTQMDVVTRSLSMYYILSGTILSLNNFTLKGYVLFYRMSLSSLSEYE